jgi:DNA-binding CsgD family transcriptional regulator
LAEAGLGPAAYQLLFSGFISDNSLRGKLNDNGKTDTNFWKAGTGKDTNHLVTESQEPKITDSQEAEISRLATSGMKNREIALKLNISEAGVYYALKNKGAKRTASQRSHELQLCARLIKKEILPRAKGNLWKPLFAYRQGWRTIRCCSSCFVTVILESEARVSSLQGATGGSLRLIL